MPLWCGARTVKHSYSGKFYDIFLAIEPDPFIRVYWKESNTN
jgi:hypothetical protein